MENKTLEKFVCPICGGSLKYMFAAKDYLGADVFAIYKCLVCNLGATKPDLSAEAMAKYYPASYYGQRKSLADNWINASRLRKIKKNKLSPGAPRATQGLLDIGCGNGGFMVMASTAGWRVAGTEIAEPLAHGRLSSMEICRRPIKECGFKSADFDIVTMWHSLEHFIEPLVYLKEAGRILKERGILLIEVPNFSSWQAVIFKNNWFHLDAPRHTFHYDKKSLSKILNQAGFKIKKISYNSLIYSCFGLVQSWLNFFCRRKNLLFDLINRKVGRQNLAKNYQDIILTILLIIPISAVALPFFFLENIFQAGSILIVWAEKK